MGAVGEYRPPCLYMGLWRALRGGVIGCDGIRKSGSLHSIHRFIFLEHSRHTNVCPQGKTIGGRSVWLNSSKHITQWNGTTDAAAAAAFDRTSIEQKPSLQLFFLTSLCWWSVSLDRTNRTIIFSSIVPRNNFIYIFVDVYNKSLLDLQLLYFTFFVLNETKFV